MTKKKDEKQQQVTISAPSLQVAEFIISGTSPYVQNKFPAKAKRAMHDKHAAGSRANKGTKKEARDFQADYRGAIHWCGDSKGLEEADLAASENGWCGIPAPAFRNAMIDACRLAGFKMTIAKCTVFIEADGFDYEDMSPLVKITKGSPVYTEMAVRNATGVCDLRARPLWAPGWEAKLRVRYDADQFSTEDVANLLLRAGVQIGVGEGRPFSKNSAGMGWGTFEIVNRAAKPAAE